MRRLVLVLALALPGGFAWAQSTEGLGRPPEPQQEKIEAKKLSKLPKQTKFVEAEYPPDAAAQNVEAEVVLLLDIDAQGKVSSVGIAEPAQPAGLGFDEAAMIAAQQFEFEPAEMDGKPIAIQLTYRYKFKLKPKEPATPPPGTETPGAAPAAPAPARAAVVNFSGLLRERGTRLPMSGVVVTVFRDDGGQPVGFEAPSDAEGRFKFFDLAPGDWKILVEAPGYYPYRTTETIAAGEAVDVTYYVEKGSYNPYDVTVTATRPRKEVSRTVLGVKEIDKVPGTFGDPLAVIQNFPGVARTPVAGVLIIRGSAPEDSRVFVDGAEVPIIYHFGGLRSVIPVGILDSIEFYPGNFNPMYGRATGGVIDVQLKKLQPKKLGGYADVSLLDTGVFLEIPLGNKGGIAIAGRRSYVDAILNAVVPDDANVGLVTAPRYYDFQLLANYRPAPAHDFRAFFLGSDDRLELLFRNPASVDTELTTGNFSSSTSFYRSIFTYKYIPNEQFENTFRISQGRNWLKFNAGRFVFDLQFYTSQIRDHVRNKLSDRITLNWGADILFAKTDFFINLPRPPKEGEPPGNFDLSQTQRAVGNGITYFSPAGFFEAELKLWPGLLLLPGFRVDHFTRIDQTLAQPRVTARQQLLPGWTLKGGVGLFVQEPDFDETDANFGNPNLKAEKAIHYSAGVEWKPRQHLTFDVTGFYKDLSSLVSPTDRFDPMTNRPLVYDNRGEGRVYGLEMVARHEFTNNFSGWFAYTVSRALRKDSDVPTERLFDFDQTHILTAVGSYLLPRNWQIGGRFRLVSGNPRTPIVGGTFNSTTDRYDAVFGAVNSARNGTFHQLDLRVDKRWVYQGWMLNLYLDIQNVYNRANPEGLTYNFNYRESGKQQGLPILTILGIRAEF